MKHKWINYQTKNGALHRYCQECDITAKMYVYKLVLADGTYKKYIAWNIYKEGILLFDRKIVYSCSSYKMDDALS